MKTLLLTAALGLAFASPVNAQDWAAQQLFLAQEQANQTYQQNWLFLQEQQRAQQQAQSGWAMQCAARMYQNCY